MNDELKRLLAQREEQDRQIAELEVGFRALRGRWVDVPDSYFEEMEAICAPMHITNNNVFAAPVGVRG